MNNFIAPYTDLKYVDLHESYCLQLKDYQPKPTAQYSSKIYGYPTPLLFYSPSRSRLFLQITHKTGELFFKIIIRSHAGNDERFCVFLPPGSQDSLLHAIKEEYVEAVELLLEHEEKIHKPGQPYVSLAQPLSHHRTAPRQLMRKLNYRRIEFLCIS